MYSPPYILRSGFGYRHRFTEKNRGSASVEVFPPPPKFLVISSRLDEIPRNFPSYLYLSFGNFDPLFFSTPLARNGMYSVPNVRQRTFFIYKSTINCHYLRLREIHAIYFPYILCSILVNRQLLKCRPRDWTFCIFRILKIL